MAKSTGRDILMGRRPLKIEVEPIQSSWPKKASPYYVLDEDGRAVRGDKEGKAKDKDKFKNGGLVGKAAKSKR